MQTDSNKISGYSQTSLNDTSQTRTECRCQSLQFRFMWITEKASKSSMEMKSSSWARHESILAFQNLELSFMRREKPFVDLREKKYVCFPKRGKTSKVWIIPPSKSLLAPRKPCFIQMNPDKGLFNR